MEHGYPGPPSESDVSSRRDEWASWVPYKTPGRVRHLEK